MIITTIRADISMQIRYNARDILLLPTMYIRRFVSLTILKADFEKAEKFIFCTRSAIDLFLFPSV